MARAIRPDAEKALWEAVAHTRKRRVVRNGLGVGVAVKRNQVAVLVVVTAFIAGSPVFFGHRFGDALTAIDDWLTEAGYRLWNEPIGPEWSFYKIAEAALPISLIAAAVLALILIWLVIRELRKAVADHVPRSRIRRRTKNVARGAPTVAPPRPKGAV